MAAVNVRVGHDDDAVIAQLIGLVFFDAYTSTKHCDESDNLLACQHLVKARFLNVQNFSF